MRRYLYLSTAVAGVVMTAGAGVSFAQCVTTQNCAELGYTETSCPDGTGIKCPFGDTFACTGGSCANDCAELGFTYPCTNTGEQGVGKPCNGKYQGCSCDSPYQYTCSGTGYSGGSGTACGGKYTKCTCKSGYTWKNGTCQKQILNGAQGDLYYCNGTVVGVKAGDMDFYVAMKDLEDMNWYDANSRCQSTQFCTHSYGTLPSTSHFYSIYQNKTNLDKLLSSNKGTAVTGRYWTSSSYNYFDHFTTQISTSSINSVGPGSQGNSGKHQVRPVLVSW